jgi:signal peptidase I
MEIDFALVLVIAVFVSGAIWLLDALVLRKRRILKDGSSAREPVLVEYARSFFPIILIVLVVRSFLFEPFRIPSSSMMPTLLVGDFIFVNKYAYGLRLPVLNSKVVEVGEPKRGDVVVFRKPQEPHVNYIKRLVGLPGDVISYRYKQVYVNDVAVPLEGSGDELRVQCGHDARNKPMYFDGTTVTETLDGVSHEIYLSKKPDFPSAYLDRVVPEGHYFVMGDNRDCSQDSRIIGFIPEQNMVGRAVGIWMNWDWDNSSLKWERIGTSIR